MGNIARGICWCLFGVLSASACGARRASNHGGAVTEGAAMKLDCNSQTPDGGIAVSAARAKARRGLYDHRFGARVSSPEVPIEVCGFRRQLEWLTAQQCADGSRPWGDDLEAAHKARRGSVVPEDLMSSCLRPIDAYVVKCPEQTYTVFINLYVCAAGEDVYDNWRRPARRRSF